MDEFQSNLVLANNGDEDAEELTDVQEKIISLPPRQELLHHLNAWEHYASHSGVDSSLVHMTHGRHSLASLQKEKLQANRQLLMTELLAKK